MADSDVEATPPCALHDAAEAGNMELLKDLLGLNPKPMPELKEDEDRIILMEDEELLRERKPDPAILERRDNLELTPVHVALLHRRLDVLKLLLSITEEFLVRSYNSTPLLQFLLLAEEVRPLPWPQDTFLQEAAAELIRVGASWSDEDGSGRTCVSVAAGLGLLRLCKQELQESPELLTKASSSGTTPLHAAAAGNRAASIKQLVALLGANATTHVNAKDAAGNTALHYAVQRRAGAAIAALLAAGADAEIANFSGLTAREFAQLKGFDLAATGAKPGYEKPTGVFWHPECSLHLTARNESRHPPSPPSENLHRLAVLCNDDFGTLRTSMLRTTLTWQEARVAAISDIVRVHEYPYVHRVAQACSAAKPQSECAPNRRQIRHVDADTSICRESFQAALRAAGAVCQAIDAVLDGSVHHAFAAVRPPGHHAGPYGVVSNQRDTCGSQGFCLFNNVAVGAAYARALHGTERICILDFDVHHGNGTEAIINNLFPHQISGSVNLPFAVGTLTTRSYKPWRDQQDGKAVQFISLHGWGPARVGEHFFYPASGDNCGLDPEKLVAAGMPPSAVQPASAAEHKNGEPAADDVLEVFESSVTKPAVVNVGCPRSLTRRQYRNIMLKCVFPAIDKFKPSLILISAGFDAHKADFINAGFIQLRTEDYHWITENVVKLANKHCPVRYCAPRVARLTRVMAQGKIVSALEGGYAIGGMHVSAFGTSVAAHVSALSVGDRELWNTNEEWKRARLEKQAIADAAAAAAAAEEAKRKAAEDAGVDISSRRSKRQRGGPKVDYAELDRQLRAEQGAAAAAATSVLSEPTTGAAAGGAGVAADGQV